MKHLFVIGLIALLLISGCSKKEKTPTSGCDLLEDCGEPTTGNEGSFKEVYEAINGAETSSGAVQRTITIPEDHPFRETTSEAIVEKISNKETFYLYMGDELCPWCRSVIEKAIEIAALAQVKDIDYVQIWDDEGNEIVRDRYELQDGAAVKVKDGIPAYETLLVQLDSALDDYVLYDDDDNEVAVGEKRIYVPLFVYVENGKVVRYTTGISDLQSESREELTPEMLKDEEEMFRYLFGAE